MNFTLNAKTGEVAFVEEGDEHSEEVDHSGDDHSTEVEHHDDGGDVNPVIPNVYDMLWALVFFGALWALMKFVLLPPIIAGRDQRNAKAQAARDAASGSAASLDAIRAEHDAKLASARAEAGRIVDEARAEVEADRAARMSEVDAQVATDRAAATAEIGAARTAAMSGARGDVDNIAVGAASAVLGRDLDVGAQKSVLDTILGS